MTRGLITMGIPKKAIKESRLKFKTAGTAVDGSHQIRRVTFFDQGIEKEAFYKTLDPEHHYPKLLAMMSVAVSAFLRSFLGDQAAEERIVVNEEGEVIGTLSFTINEFTVLNYAGEMIPIESPFKELVVPSTKTLIETKFMEILLSRFFIDDDDGHPHNFGFSVVDRTQPVPSIIDFDMALYWFTIYMKEPRPIIGIPKKNIHFTVADWERFPRIRDAKLYHWASYTSPGQESLTNVLPGQANMMSGVLPKPYADPTQFQALANSPEAQEQKLAAALKILLTYQPDVLRARLVSLFGDLPLNYTALGQSLSVRYEREFPLLCNEQTNTQPFVEFMMKLYQDHYDSLYRVVVFYMGCENNGHGVPLLPTCTALYKRPSYYQQVVAWVNKQNTTLYALEEPSCRYEITQLEERYHQIWRDAFAPGLKSLLNDTFELANQIIKDASLNATDQVSLDSNDTKAKTTTDETCTQAWDLFGSIPELSIKDIEEQIAVDAASTLRPAVIAIGEFSNKLYRISKIYYEKNLAALTVEDNIDFVEGLKELHSKYNFRIMQLLATTSSFASRFACIIRGINKITGEAHLALHLLSSDELMSEEVNGVSKPVLLHTDERIINEFCAALFIWAKTQKNHELTRIIHQIIDAEYTGYLGPGRSIPVKTYLTVSEGKESNDNRLAYIFSSGTADGRLNKLLIKNLAPKVILTQHLPSIRHAIHTNNFDSTLDRYAAKAHQLATHGQQFFHLYHKQGILCFYNTMYDWLDELPDRPFKLLLTQVLASYEAGLSGLRGLSIFGSKSRRMEVEGYLRYGQAIAVAMTFLHGDKTSTLNAILFDKIIDEIQLNLKRDTTKQTMKGYQLILQYTKDQHKEVYIQELKNCAGPISHRIANKAIS